MLNFVKRPTELYTELDKWLYAFKHLTEFKERPEYLSGPEFDQFFNLAKYANLTAEERAMYNRSLKYKWDNKNVMDYAVAQATLKAKQEMALKLLAKKTSIEEIAELTGLTFDEIEALKK
ncbi:putative transposase/invertase (TIGR01784 family) [Pedobacter africanus]